MTLAVIGGVLAVNGALVSSPTHARAAVTGPNVLFISYDDVDCGQFGSGRFDCRDAQPADFLPQTTAAILDQGVTFRDARAADPKCCSTRMTWQTGLYAHNHGLHTFADTMASYAAMAGKTLPEALQAAGYRTILAGKLFHRWPACQNPRGWDRYLVVKADSYAAPHPIDQDGVCATSTTYSTTEIGAYVRQEIAAATAAGQPWFVYMSFIAPHRPHIPSPKYAKAPVPVWQATAEPDRSDKPSWVLNSHATPAGEVSEYVARARTLMSVDDEVAATMQEVSDLAQQPNTMEITQSDNGYCLGQHGLISKFVPYQCSVNLPTALRWDGHVLPGAVDDRLASTVDIAPTIYAATGVTPPVPQDGESLLSPSVRTWWYTEDYHDLSARPGWPTWRAAGDGSTTYVDYYAADGSIRAREAYDETADPDELSNLFHDGIPGNEPDKTLWDARLAAEATCSGAACVAAQAGAALPAASRLPGDLPSRDGATPLPGGGD